MIKIILYKNKSLLKIVRRIVNAFSKYSEVRTTEKSLWLNGLFFEFKPHSITINPFDKKSLNHYDIIKKLPNILEGEEICITCPNHYQYIKSVNSSTDFASILQRNGGGQ